ncbi:MAG: hypothetical protein R2749_04935 [Acidimicrobiales bacterium]
MKRLIADPQSMAAILGAMAASAWLNDQLLAWLGERNAADVLTRSVPGNVTSEMGLALLDVADAIRPHPQAVAVLAEPGGEDLLGRLATVPGGTAAVEAIDGFLERYGMRCGRGRHRAAALGRAALDAGRAAARQRPHLRCGGGQAALRAGPAGGAGEAGRPRPVAAASAARH